VNGLKLTQMNASDMLDVLHYYFEEDMKYATPQQAEIHNNLREIVYEKFYGVKYAYSNSETTGGVNDSSGLLDDELNASTPVEELKPFNPRSASNTKEYIPASNFNPEAQKPFGSVLDAPLG
jgi:hypothetical protein